MLKSLQTALLVIFFGLIGMGGVWGQTYTTTGNSTNWNDPAAWIRTGNCGTTNNGGPPPPLSLNPGNSCPVKIIVNHPISYSGNATIGGGYMDSLIINTGGNLSFSGNLTVNNVGNSVGPFAFRVKGGRLSVNGTYSHRNGATLEIIQKGSVNIGNKFDANNNNGGKILVDATSQLVVKNELDININNPFQVYGYLETTDLNTGSGGGIEFLGNSKIVVKNNINLTNGSIIAADNSDIRVGNDFNMQGGGRFVGRSNSYLEIEGNHNIGAYNTVELSNYSQVSIKGNTIGGLTLQVIEMACYKSSNKSGGTACILCGETFISDGTFYVPAGVTEVTIEAWGGGAAGGNGTAKVSGGGGGGAYSKSVVAVSPGQPLAVYVGAGGDPRNSNTSLRDGQISYVSDNSSLPPAERIANSLVYANGGRSPDQNSGSAGAGGEIDPRADISYKGSNGYSPSGNGGYGGSAASTNGSASTSGQDPLGIGGAGGLGGYGSGNGSNGFIYGGGGGGANIKWDNGLLYGGAGAGGVVMISYTCPSKEPCSRVVNYGTKGDYYIIEYFCDGTWEAPEGLAEFGVTAIGGGGGGGFGDAAGGGGGGGIFSTPKSEEYLDINKNSTGQVLGLPAGTAFTIKVGAGGNGATNTIESQNGSPSFVSGEFTNSAGDKVVYLPLALGGGGGGSTISGSTRNGKANFDGVVSASGGGGAYINEAGNGGQVPHGSNHANKGGDAGTGPSTRIYGAGGGGAGTPGSTNEGNNRAGKGGDGIGIPEVQSQRPALLGTYSAGGGGTMSGPGQSERGEAGNGGGGNGNLSGIGGNGNTNSGSGGGAGLTGGGAGGSGKVFIYYPVYQILDVEYLFFTAKLLPENRTGLLSWATAKEWQNSHFEIERAVNSIDTWETIGRIDGTGYSDSPSSYSFRDEKPPLGGGDIFYRLKQVNLDGTFSYSVTRAIRLEAIEGRTYWIAYPNPTQGHDIQLASRDNFPIGDGVSVSVVLRTSLGQTEAIAGTSLEEINTNLQTALSQMSAGLYLIQITWGDKQEMLRVIKI